MNGFGGIVVHLYGWVVFGVVEDVVSGGRCGGAAELKIFDDEDVEGEGNIVVACLIVVVFFVGWAASVSCPQKKIELIGADIM